MIRSRHAVVAAALLLVVSTGAVGAVAPTQSVESTDRVPTHGASITSGIESGQALHAQQSGCSFPVEVTDATGETVTIEDEPDSVVALGASVAQTMWAIDAESKVVGLPTGYTTAYLNDSQNRTNVLGTSMNPIVENIVRLDPDVVLAANIIDEDDVETLRENGLTVVYFEEANSLDDVVKKTRLTGELVGSCEDANAVVDEMESTIESVRENANGSENPSVYYAMGGGYTAGPDTFIGDVIATAGGDNVATAANIQTYGEISEEVIAQQNPDWIVMPDGRQLRQSAAINATTAVQKDQIIRVNANFISQPGPRVTEPLGTLSAAFNPGNETTATPETTAGGDGSGPGFGPVAALVALVSAGLLARRP